MHKKCSGVRGKLKEDSKYKRQGCTNQQTDISVDSAGIELSGLSLEIVEKFYLGDTIGARRSAFNTVITRIRSK